jgi:ABC-type polysaccharide/polyol phosphate export permease
MGSDNGPELLTTVYDSHASQSFLRFFVNNVRDLYRFRHAIANFVVNTLRMRYRRSVLGFAWSLLNPLLVMMVIAVVFATAFHQDIKTFSMYVFSGLVPWNYISASIQSGCLTIVNAEGFLKKVYLPKTLFPVVMVSTETANFLFSIVSLYFLALILGFPVRWSILLLPLALAITFIFNLGWAFLFGVLTVYFRDLTHIIMVLFQAFFYLVPIVYPLEAIPPHIRPYYFLNPFYYFIMLFRKIIYGEPALTLVDWAGPILLATFVFLVGFWVVMHHDKDLIYRL